MPVSRDRDNKARRLLLPGKNNLAAEGQGLAFTIADDGAGPAIRWESEPVDMNADEAIQEENAPDESRHTALDDAIAWLQETLADGSVAAREIARRARAEGIADSTLDRAKTSLGVCSRKQDHGGKAAWLWRLPRADRTVSDDDAQTAEVAVASLS